MRIFVIAKASSKTEKVEKVSDELYRVSVKSPAQDGKANEAIAQALAHYLNVSFAHIKLLSGKSSKRKVFEVIGKH